MSKLDDIKSSESKSFKKLNPHIFGAWNEAIQTLNHGGEDDALTAKKSKCRMVVVRDGLNGSHAECVVHGKDCPELSPFKQPKKKKRIRQSEKPELNRLENEWYEHIKHLHAKPQAIKLRLARNCFYKPDFFSPTTMTAWEVKGLKGKNIDRGKLALKVAATAWPEIKFILVWKEDGKWQEQHVLP